MSVELNPGEADPDPVERVGEDADLLSAEKETTITFAKDDDRARVFTAEAGLMRRLLAHPDAEVSAYALEGGNTTPDEWGGETIVGVTSTLPLRYLSVLSEGRSNDQHARIISRRVVRDGGEGN